MIDFRQTTASQMAHSGAAAGYDAGLRDHMLKVYRNLGLGLGLSTLTAFITMAIPGLLQLVHGSPLGLVVQLAPIGILFFLMFKMNTLSSATLKKVFYLFCGLKGVALSYIVLVYTGQDVVRSLALTAAIFGGVSMIGYTTKRDLTSMGFFLMTGVFALFLASMVTWGLSAFGVQTGNFSFILMSGMALLVIGLTAYETQDLKRQYYQLSGEQLEKASMMTTLNLYINIILIFQWILSLIGGNRE